MAFSMRAWWALGALLAAGAARADVQGISLADVLTARSLGMGGAFRALGTSPDAMDGNPATMGLFKAYQVDVDGAWDANTKAAYGGTFVRDSQTSSLAAGAGYHLLSTGRGPVRETTNVTTLALALPFGDSFSIGAGGRYLLRTHPGDPADAVTMDAGAAVRLAEGLTLAVGAHNLIDTHHAELPRYYSAAVGLAMGALSLDFDARSDLSGRFRPVLNGGAEYVLGGVAPVRVGYAWDLQASQQFFSLGAGVTSEGSGVDFAWRHATHGGSDLLVLSLRMQM